MFRLDRLLTLYLIGPLWKRLPVKGLRIPILMYHSISDDPETGHPYYWINTKPPIFSEQMRFLYENDYQVIPISTAVEIIRAGNSKIEILNSKFEIQNEEQPTNKLKNQSSTKFKEQNRPNKRNERNKPRYVVLTFDDGYLDFYTQAFPVLRQYGFTATVFLPTDYIDSSKPGLKGKYHLTWDLVRELSQSGIDFGSHTCSHPQLYELSPAEIESELRKSKETIEFQLKKEQIQNPIFETQNGNQPRGYFAQLASSLTLKKESTNKPLNQSTRFPITVASFCYPYKFPEADSSFIKALQEILLNLGYVSCATTRIGSVNAPGDLSCLKRLPINTGDDSAFLAAILSGQYDWLYGIQFVKKFINKLVHTKKKLDRH
jgi:peptidoglycan/xylan/chitin deacetylase (PgdA/CDA1 family)